MKRDPDLIREVLLRVEASTKPPKSFQLFPEATDPTEIANLNYQLSLLFEAGYLKGTPAHHMASRNWLNMELTWRGHDYVDAVRDPEIWRKTKEGAAKAGDLSLEVLGALAKGLVKKQIERLTGIELDL